MTQIRKVVVFTAVVVGLSLGFFFGIVPADFDYPDIPSTPEDHMSLRSFCGENTRIPVFDENTLKAVIHADRVEWTGGQVIELENPEIYEIGDDGVTVVSYARGDYGEIRIDDLRQDLSGVSMRGNVVMRRNGATEEK